MYQIHKREFINIANSLHEALMSLCAQFQLINALIFVAVI
jgi:hypothetical protein